MNSSQTVNLERLTSCPHEAKLHFYYGFNHIIFNYCFYLFIYLHIFYYCDLKFTSSVRYSLKMFGSKLLLLLLLLLLLFYVSSIFYSKHLCF